MGQRRSGNDQHFSAPGPDNRHSDQYVKAKSIGLSTAFKDSHAKDARKASGPSRAQRAAERAHSRYPYGQGVYWLSVLAFVSFVLASLYWIAYFASTS